ncbi:MAG: ABC transporter ATP-binding protein [Gammaproteobacteria bacterium]|nr:ABC transporter ATP-binding protein [Gammaproteobacteria bacterium]
MADAAIEVVGLSKQFIGVAAVDNISFAVRRGSTCALLGGNGAGKTTTLSMLLGLLLPTSGSIRILGVDMLRDRYQVLPRMCFMSPYADLPQRLTVSQNLEVFARLYAVPQRKQRISELAALLDLQALLQRPYGALSAGQRTRVSLAKALLNRPEVMLLDEPTASLDPDTADRMRQCLRDYQRDSGATLLLASHNMPEVERLCDEVLMLKAGHIVDRGSPQQLLDRYGRASMEQVFLDIARGEVSHG